MNLDLPKAPGVYIFKDASGNPIYIGKALDVAKRVKNHFSKNEGSKRNLLIEKVKDIEVHEVDSEIEALILEANLIKKHLPIYNSQLKDDKDYLYIKITNDEFPRVLTARRKDLDGSRIYFGPYPSANKVRLTLKTLQKIFNFSSCKPNQKRACLYYHLGICPGVCIGQISRRDYLANIKKLTLFLEGKSFQVIRELEKERDEASKNMEFEKAARLQKRLEAVHYITRPIRNPMIYEEKEISELRSKELDDLATVIGLAKQPVRIECYDVSNISGQDAVGSMVVFTNGQADKDHYRRFLIKGVKGINDPAMIKEIIERRLRNDWPLPDLMIVDGGKTQLKAGLAALASFSHKIPLIGLAKRFEEIYLPNQKKPLRLARTSDALRLVQRIRDEAHRFAISYHRKLRTKRFLTTL